MMDRYEEVQELQAFHGSYPLNCWISMEDHYTREVVWHLLRATKVLTEQNVKLARRISELEAGDANAHPA